MEFGMPFLMECGTVEENAALCAELGLSFLELNLCFPPSSLEQLTPERLAEIRKRYSVDMTIHLHDEFEPCGFEEGVSAAWVRHAVKAINLAREAGLPTVNMHWLRGAHVTLPDRVVYLSEAYQTQYQEKVLDFRKACAEASQGKVSCCIENLEEGWLPFQQEAIRLLLGDPTFGLTMDIGHMAVGKGKDEEFFRANEKRLRHMHAHDSVGGHCHLPFGTGEIDLNARLALAKRCGARVVLEVKTKEALRQTVGWLRTHPET